MVLINWFTRPFAAARKLRISDASTPTETIARRYRKRAEGMASCQERAHVRSLSRAIPFEAPADATYVMEFPMVFKKKQTPLCLSLSLHYKYIIQKKKQILSVAELKELGYVMNDRLEWFASSLPTVAFAFKDSALARVLVCRRRSLKR